MMSITNVHFNSYLINNQGYINVSYPSRIIWKIIVSYTASLTERYSVIFCKRREIFQSGGNDIYPRLMICMKVSINIRDGIKRYGKFVIFTRLKIDLEKPPPPIFSPNFSEICPFHPPSPYL